MRYQRRTRHVCLGQLGLEPLSVALGGFGPHSCGLPWQQMEPVQESAPSHAIVVHQEDTRTPSSTAALPKVPSIAGMHIGSPAARKPSCAEATFFVKVEPWGKGAPRELSSGLSPLPREIATAGARFSVRCSALSRGRCAFGTHQGPHSATSLLASASCFAPEVVMLDDNKGNSMSRPWVPAPPPALRSPARRM
jgi:hypothetical protein